MKDLTQEICEAGVAAVEGYKQISGLLAEDRVPERYLSTAMATHLHRLPGVQTKVERDYLLLATEDLKLQLPPSRRNELDQLRADIALYENGNLVAIVEVKIFAEGGDPAVLIRDLNKGGDIFTAGIAVYGAFLVCETAKRSLEDQEARLKPLLGESLYFSPPHQSASSSWKWCFGCVRGKSRASIGAVELA